MKAIELCVARFDKETKEAFLDLYSKVDAKVNPPPKPEIIEPVLPPDAGKEIPF
jgi:hypothetical protein